MEPLRGIEPRLPLLRAACLRCIAVPLHYKGIKMAVVVGVAPTLIWEHASV